MIHVHLKNNILIYSLVSKGFGKFIGSMVIGPPPYTPNDKLKYLFLRNSNFSFMVV